MGTIVPPLPEGPVQDRIAALAPMVRRVVRGVLGFGHDAEDAEQEAFTQAFACLPRFDGRGSLEGWVRCIAVRTALRIRRRRRWTRWLLHDDTPAPDPAPGPDAERVSRLLRALDKLSAQERAAFVMKYQEDRPFAEVAEAIGCAEVTARSYAFRASQKLRRLLGGAP